jgi:hypothetical protein
VRFRRAIDRNGTNREVALAALLTKTTRLAPESRNGVSTPTALEDGQFDLGTVDASGPLNQLNRSIFPENLIMAPQFIRWFADLGMDDIPSVGGKNANLGELYRELTPRGIRVPNGFAVTATGYGHFLKSGNLVETIRSLLSGLDTRNLSDLAERGRHVRERILATPLPHDLELEILAAYAKLGEQYGPGTDVAVCSSATAEDLPRASFAGQQESYLNICGDRALLQACHQCIASLFTDRAISYRVDKEGLRPARCCSVDRRAEDGALRSGDRRSAVHAGHRKRFSGRGAHQ